MKSRDYFNDAMVASFSNVPFFPPTRKHEGWLRPGTHGSWAGILPINPYLLEVSQWTRAKKLLASFILENGLDVAVVEPPLYDMKRALKEYQKGTNKGRTGEIHKKRIQNCFLDS